MAKQLCEYGCGQEAIHQFKNGKWCCSKTYQSCPCVRRKISKKLSDHTPWNKGKNNIYSENTLKKMKESHLGSKNYWYEKELTKTHKQNISKSNKGKILSDTHKNNLRISLKNNKNAKGKKYNLFIYNSRRITIELINDKHLIFSKIEEMRYKLNKKEIQVHCKNHNCSNSKEQGGWFTPTYSQIYERIRQIEHGNGGCYFYCSEKCKNECPLYNLRNDPISENIKSYTSSEYKTFRDYVLKRDNYECQYCGGLAEHVHHERPQKLEPFFALDPDLALSVCKKCHYKYGHKNECSSVKLANKICI